METEDLNSSSRRDEICSIRTQNSVVSSQQEVLEAFSSFYKELFTSSEPDPCMEVAKAKIRSIIPKKIKDEEAKVLDGGLSVEDIIVAIR